MKKLLIAILTLGSLSTYADVSPEYEYDCVGVDSHDEFHLKRSDKSHAWNGPQWKVKTTLIELEASGKTAMWSSNFQEGWKDEIIEIRIVTPRGGRFYVTPKKVTKNGESYFRAHIGNLGEHLKVFKCNL